MSSGQLWSKGLPIDEVLHRFTVGEDPVTDLALMPFDAEGSAAHARMLSEAGLLSKGDAKALVAQLRTLREKAIDGQLTILPEQEDCHTALEAYLTEALGDAGKSIHLGRSRNDQVITAMRLLMRDRLLRLGLAATAVTKAFLQLAKDHESISLPGYTHLRRGMPSSWGQWGEAFAEGLLEELEALPGLWKRLDKCPLGAAAGFGTSLPLNRERSAELMGFSRVQRSPIDVNNSRGRHEQAVAAWIVSIAHTLEKAIWDLSIYSTEECGFVRLPDAYTTGSSIMPQKRNPDVLELLRGRCRELRGLAGQLAHLAGGMPSSYHREWQLLKKPFIELLDKGMEMLEVTERMLPGLRIQAQACAAACSDDLYAAQEAYRLVDVEGIPFRDAYKRVASQIQDGTFHPDRSVPTHSHTGAPGNLGLDQTTTEIAQAEAWILTTQRNLGETMDQLFAWTD